MLWEWRDSGARHMETMKAVRMHEYGGPGVLIYEDAPRPQAEGLDVLVRVEAAGVNPVDWKVREGYLRKRTDYHLPLILGWDVSGTVEASGPDAKKFKAGDHVYSRPDITRDGAYAEYIAIRETELALKPRSVDHVQAAGMPLAALTAWQTLFDAAELKAGQKVLIHGAAGGVGGYAVQLAKWKGAYVYGTASARNQGFLRELGVDEPIDYQKTRFDDVVHAVDVVLDTIGGETRERSWKTLRRGGILVSIVSEPEGHEAELYGVRCGYVFVSPSTVQLEQIANLVDFGKIKPLTETVLPLTDARRAHELSQSGHARGKIVLSVD